MSIKNAIMGGTDWNEGDILYAEDLNDTFDNIGWLWFLDPDMYTMYDGFEGGSIDAGKWGTSLSGIGASVTVSTSTNAGGGGTKEADILGGTENSGGSAILFSVALPTGKRGYHAKLYWSVTHSASTYAYYGLDIAFGDSGYFQYSLGTGGYNQFSTAGYFSVLINKNESTGLYDMYFGGKLVATGITGGEIYFKCNSYAGYTTNAHFYVDDVIYSNVT